MNLEKVTNPNWVATMAPEIQKVVDKILLPNINYHSLVVHLQNIVQFGGENQELWVAWEDGDQEHEPPKVIGFAAWSVRFTPYVGSVYLEWIYSKRLGVAEALLREFEQFAIAKNAPFLMCEIINSGKLVEHLGDIIAKEGYKFIEAPYKSYVAIKGE